MKPPSIVASRFSNSAREHEVGCCGCVFEALCIRRKAVEFKPHLDTEPAAYIVHGYCEILLC